jgi:hypothetical protein
MQRMKDWENCDYEKSGKMVAELQKRRTSNRLSSEERTKIKEAFELISHLCNVGAERALADEILFNLLDEHRTLQQGFWRTIFMMAQDYADAAHDARNGGAVEACKKIKEAFPDGFYLPLI